MNSEISRGGGYFFADDFCRNTGKTWKGTPKQYLKILTNHGVLYLYAYRKDQQAKKRYTIWHVLKRRLRLKYGLEIDSKCIGSGFRLVHPYNITIGPAAVIGSNCTIHKGATVGRESRGKRRGSPTLGDRVWVGINATVVGKIAIGNNVLIAPNSLVNFDVPDNSIVIGCPGKILKDRADATDGYL